MAQETGSCQRPRPSCTRSRLVGPSSLRAYSFVSARIRCDRLKSVGLRYETRHSSRLSFYQCRAAERRVIPHPLHLRERRGDAQPRYRSVDSSGLDGWPTAYAGSRRSRVSVQCEICGLHSEAVADVSEPWFRLKLPFLIPIKKRPAATSQPAFLPGVMAIAVGCDRRYLVRYTGEASARAQTRRYGEPSSAAADRQSGHARYSTDHLRLYGDHRS